MYRIRILIEDENTVVTELCKRLLEPEVEVIGPLCNSLPGASSFAVVAVIHVGEYPEMEWN